MAQTKAAPPRQRSGGARKTQKRSRAKPKRAAPRKPKGPLDRTKAAGESVEETAKDAGRAVGRVATKAKVPLVAGGAALAGAIGGAAVATRRGSGHRGLGAVSSKDLAKMAKKAGNVGAEVGEIALEVKRARERSNGSTHRSPIEVVLQGLTSRGPRG